MAAESSSSEQSVDAHAQFYATLRAGVDDNVALDNTVKVVIAELQYAIPEFAILEASKPGFLKSLEQGIRPVLQNYSTRVQTLYEPRMIAALRNEITAEEAASLMEFYGSPLGKKVLASVNESFTGEAMIRGAITNPDNEITIQELSSDIKRATINSYLSLTVEERQAVNAITLQNPAFKKLQLAQQKLQMLRTEMENTPMTADEEAQLNAAMEKVFNEYMDE